MPRIARSRKGADILFVGAVILLVAGIWLLPVTTGAATRPGRLWPLLLVGAGAIWLYLALSRRFTSGAVLGGTMLGLSGLLLVLSEFLGWRTGQIWPLFMIVLGLSLLAKGFSRSRSLTASYLVPALCFMGLGVFFAAFSFDATPLSFMQFMRAYWPLAFVVGGAGLFGAWALGRSPLAPRRKRRGREGKA